MTTTENVERATALTEQVIDRGAPWGAGATWQIVVVEAIGAGLVGLIMLFDIGGSSTILKLLGLLLLGLALIGAFQVWRKKVRPERTSLAAFRVGSGVTTGILVLVATFLAPVSDTVTASLAVVVGVGFAIFGLAGIIAPLIGRQGDEQLPLGIIAVNIVVLVIGVVLLFAGAGGASQVNSVFRLVGILLIFLAVGLGGWAYVLYQRQSAARLG